MDDVRRWFALVSSAQTRLLWFILQSSADSDSAEKEGGDTVRHLSRRHSIYLVVSLSQLLPAL